MRDNYSRPPREICNDPFADNFEEVDYSNPSVDPFFKPDTVNNDVCTYCDLPKKINEIKNKEGAKVKSSLNKLKQEGKEQCKKEICESGSTAYSNQCTIATEFKEQYAYLQMYLYLSDEDPGTLDGIYRGSKEITSTPTAGSNTRKALVQFGSNPANLAKIKGNQCQFMSTLLQKELIKDYEPESEERIKVTQMALAMDDINPYKGSIDGDQIKTYNLLQKKYGWSNEKFGVSYIAGPDMNWQVGRATQFHEDGTPFMRRPS